MTGHNDAQAQGQGRIYQSTGDQHITEHHHHGPNWNGPDSVRRPAIGRTPVVLRDRTSEMDRLRAAVEPGTANRVYVLHGLGGCGKTAVAYTLFKHATEQAQRIGLWVNASDPASLRAGMLAVAADRGATDGELIGARSGLRPAADLVWHYLDNSDQPWLLVLDNADDPAILRDGSWLRTSPAGTVLVTSRQAAAHWWPGADLLQFGVLPRDEAALVLRDLAPHAGSIEDAAEVADRLGRLPLALTLAGGFLAHQVIDPWTLADYRTKLDGTNRLDTLRLIDQGAHTNNDSRHLLSHTWQLSLDALTTQGQPEATHLLRLLACWSSDPLPIALLSRADLGPQLPTSRVETALRGLLDHSLTELVHSTERCVRTHGVLLDSVARDIPDHERGALAAVAADMLKAQLPEIPERGAPDPRISLLAPHIIALLHRVQEWTTEISVTESAAECALRLAVSLHRTADYTSALNAANDTIELVEPRMGASHSLVIKLRQRAGRSVYRLGRFEEAESLHRAILNDCEQAYGPDSLETLESCLALSRPIWQLGREAESATLIHRAIAGRAALLGREHPLTLLARTSILELTSPPTEELLDHGEETVEICRQSLGRMHSITLVAELNYACALQLAGRNGDSIPRARMSLEAYERKYGDEYPITLAARSLLSLALGESGQYAEAVRHIQLVAIGRTRILGQEHAWTRSAEDRLRRYKNTLGQE